MDLTTWLAICSFVCSVPQGAAAIVFILDRLRQKPAEAKLVSTKRRAIFLATMLVVGTASTAALGGWLLGHPLKPVTVEKTVTVEKLVPCPPAKTGAATTRGAQSPANSGSGNTTTYGSQPAQLQPPPKQKE